MPTCHQRGEFAPAIDTAFFADNRRRLCQAMRNAGAGEGQWVLVQQSSDQPIRPTADVEHVYRPVGSTTCVETSRDTCDEKDGYFWWALGVEVPDYFAAVEVMTGRTVLFMPRLPESYNVIMGEVPTPEAVMCKYGVDGVYYVDEMDKIFNQIKPNAFHVLDGVNTDSGRKPLKPSFEGVDKFTLKDDLLFEVFNECRVVKSPAELDLLRYAVKVSCDAHKKLMINTVPGVYEFQSESDFQHHAYREGGCRHVGYTCIAASSGGCAVLHYGHAGEPNKRRIEDGDMCLFDMGAEYGGYTADITISFPANGKFTPEQKIVYNAVFDASRSVMKAIKPGVSYVEMHKLAERVILRHLVQAGILQGDIEEMMLVNLGAVFMPHGLGHFMGIDVHDVGGYPKGTTRLTEPGLRSLRTVRSMLQNMVLTVEPGCYMNDYCLDKALADPRQAKFINNDVLHRFRGLGGVRIEDDIAITADGCENMSASLPRTVEQIEAFIALNRK